MTQESFLRADMLNRLILTIAELREEMREMRIFKEELEVQLEDAIEVSRPRHTQQEKLAYGLFADNLSPKPEDIHGSQIDDKTFNTVRDHFTLFRLPATIRQIKDEFKIEAGKPYKAADAQGKLRAVELLEQTAAPFVPLRACVGSWGARLMLQADNDNAFKEQDLHPPSSSVEESDSSGENDINPIDAAIVLSQTAGRYEQSGKTKTVKRRISTVEKDRQVTKRKMTKKAN
ncbi:hypothetical protein G6F70_001569 [Rhizopus microsporus]|nr:hypothetical protein G6F71_001684 [Rhizopus microsporus]KAG1203209.1 hypothetical protein G6F70_001569 [Rhizopus microsporus]KAG1214843.1 hypothetical protein G6F69_001537 [Rhizopus microsporus]KAG1237317.1 hypothetical protein G6F67_001280 [Rhizopus microsporus]KAG1266259.1 hypothetical protein G6F68_002889 [Rhizopus microsporus]